MKIFLRTAILLAFSTTIYCGKKEKILADGSSTVYPITEAVAEEYLKEDRSTHVTVGISGTGGGFKKFCHGETDISNASRQIKASEIEECKKIGLRYLEMQIAYDGLAVVINPKNTFVDKLTVEQLKSIFSSEKPAATWKDVNPTWPAEALKIFSPGQDSGTYDYFSETIIGKGKSMRNDVSFSEDDNVLVTGIAGNEYAVGFFGLAYYEENKERLNLVAVVNPAGEAVKPDVETVMSGKYAPLSRPVFIYGSDRSLARPPVRKFVNFYLKNAGRLARDVGYIPLKESEYAAALESLNQFK